MGEPERTEAVPAPRGRFALGDLFIGPDGPRAGWCLPIFLMLVAVLYECAGMAMASVYPHRQSQAGGLIQPGPAMLGEGLMCVVVLTASWVMSRLERRPMAVYGLARTRSVQRFASGFVWGFAALSLLVGMLRWAGLLAFGGMQLHGAEALRWAAIWVVFFGVLAVFEEYAYRGYLQYTLARGLAGTYAWLRQRGVLPQAAGQAAGFWTAALVLSFGFGLMHRTNAGESPVGLLAASLIALIFCLTLWRTGSLWWAVGFHAAWDWAQSFVFGVADSGVMVQGHLLASHPQGSLLLSGGATGPEGSLLVLPVLAVVSAGVVLALPRDLKAAR